MTAIASIPWSRELAVLARRHADRPAVNTGTVTLSYGELERRARGLAQLLVRRGVIAGTRIAYYLPNGIAAVWAGYGITMTGACEVPLNPAYTADELAWCVQLSEVRVIVTDRARIDAVRALGVDAVLVEECTPATDDVLLPNVPADAWGRIIFSSGTTGKPKALVYSHARRWLANLNLKAALPFTPKIGSRILLMTPYVHGSSLQAYAWLDHGGEAVLLNGIDVPTVERFLASGTIDAVFAPPTVVAKLADAFPGRHFPGVQCMFTGTSTLTPGLYEKARTLFGPVVRITYGKGENFNPITVLEPHETEAVYRSAEPLGEGACLGWPPAGVELTINDPESGRELGTDEAGEIRLRSRHMYLGHIDASGFHPVSEDNPENRGWHHTGDLGRIDAAGRLWLMGRLADVIKTGGYKVYPEEIEAVLSGTPGCTQLVVATVPSDYWGEIIVAAAEGTNGRDDWIAAAQARLPALAKYKHPRGWMAIEPLPRNPQGKLNRRAVRQAILDEWVLEDGPRPTFTRRAG